MVEMIERWRIWQFAQSLSRRTVDERSATVRRMSEWCGVAPEYADVEHVVSWLAEGGNWSARTRWTYYGALSAWFLWLQQQGHRQDNPMVMIGRPKRPKSVPRPVSNHDVQRLLAVRAHRRTRAMILLAAFQGLRVHEIAQIKGEHLDLVERTMTVTGKGNVTATLPLHHRVVEMAYQMPRKGHWFPGPDRGHQRRESISGTIKEAMIRAGVIGSAHMLRHWFGTALLEANVDLRTVQELMRHQSLTSTEIYTRVTDQRRAEGIERLDPFRLAPARRVPDRLLAHLVDDDENGEGTAMHAA
ncbi:integrase [Mycobacterium phage BigNuz]|uniref:Integrase n=1 Tax=Mycobacterium phage BigNuz TaxID=1074309 RepID=G1JX48_9CAUD|nr:integrase [Mycobacterium phage BigNuz]AEL98196.1 tyrosine integrase [Mycobacterium phage BigNuz]